MSILCTQLRSGTLYSEASGTYTDSNALLYIVLPEGTSTIGKSFSEESAKTEQNSQSTTAGVSTNPSNKDSNCQIGQVSDTKTVCEKAVAVNFKISAQWAEDEIK